MNYEKGLLLDTDLQKALKEKFYYADLDLNGAERLFFDNSGGSLRLKAAVEAKAQLEMLPDCPERFHEQALELNDVVQTGTKDILSYVFGTEKGALMTELTASQTMFHMVELVMENIPTIGRWNSSLHRPPSISKS